MSGTRRGGSGLQGDSGLQRRFRTSRSAEVSRQRKAPKPAGEVNDAFAAG